MDEHEQVAESAAEPARQEDKPVNDGVRAELRKELDQELHPPKGVWLWRAIRGAMPSVVPVGDWPEGSIQGREAVWDSRDPPKLLCS